jgi:hypothetical protein
MTNFLIVSVLMATVSYFFARKGYDLILKKVLDKRLSVIKALLLYIGIVTLTIITVFEILNITDKVFSIGHGEGNLIFMSFIACMAYLLIRLIIASFDLYQISRGRDWFVHEKE